MVPGGAILSPLNPSFYSWRQSPLSPSQWHRLALSNECMWFSRPKDLHSLFICTLITLKPPIHRPTLTSAASLAWQILRFQVPELAADATCTEDGAVYMQYLTPQSQVEVDAWADRTSHFETGREVLDFKELRANVLLKKRGHDSDQTFLLLYSQTREGKDDLVENVQVMLYADHQVTDGTGLKILLGKYLFLLASALQKPAGIQQDEVKWSESYKNLSTPWIQHMNDNQVTSGPEYEETVTRNQDIILNKLKLNPGLPLSQNTQNTRPASQETHFITLSQVNTSAILQAIKNVLGPSSNITHLCHAAMVLALLRACPPSSSSSSSPAAQTLYFPCWLNGRRYLKSTPTCPSPKANYIPICLSFAPIIFTNLTELALSSTASRDEIRKKLIKACCMATKQYIGIRERKSMLPECVNLFEDIGRMMLLTKKQKPPDSTEPPSKDDIKTSQRSPKTAEPFLLSDGLTEQYISHSYPPSTSSTTLPSPPTLTVRTIHVAAHAERNLIVRMSSWRGSTTISGEWRGEDYEEGVVVRFLGDVVGIMGVIVEGG
ncbi:hypothetical protein DL98DRAFT_512580 [Cadophora sp. DSE1049]|nr:hypothetical protein DL98DRAFT_512580 [Cadophora sp. DSE1049]